MNTEVIRILLDLFNNRAPIGRTFGMTLSYTEDGAAVFDLPYNPGLDHALGGVHGGVYATLLDSATWFTAAAAQDSACWMATSDLTIHFLRPARKTPLRCVGHLIKAGARQSVAEGHLYDGGGNLIGHAVGTFVVMPDKPLAENLPAVALRERTSGRLSTYDEKYAGDVFYWGRKPSTMALRVLEFIRPTEDIHPLLLDIGCGEGRDAVHFARLGFRVVGLDSSERGLEKTRLLAAECGVEVETLRADLKTWSPDREYDVIFSTGALQYLPPEVRPERFAQYKAATTPAGVHILSVFVHKPFIPPAPDANDDEVLFRPGELLEYYGDWEIPHFAEDIFDCDSGGVPHKHAMQRMVARRFEASNRE